jgi:hypothetical protein
MSADDERLEDGSVKTDAARIQELEEKVDRLDDMLASRVPMPVFNKVLAALVEDVDDYSAITREDVEQVEDLRSMILRHESIIEEKQENPDDPQQANWLRCVEEARRCDGMSKHVRQDGYVALYVDDVAKACDCSERHARRLIEDLGDEFEGAEWLEHQPASASNGHNSRPKQLLVDLDVWGNE